MKRTLLFSAVALAGFARAQDFDQKVTFVCVAEPADQVITQLAAKTNVKLAADPAMGAETLLISVKDAPIGELMKRISAATDGQWAKSGGTYRLVPDVAKQTAEADKYVKARQDQIAHSFQDIQKKSLPPGPLQLLSLQDASVLARLSPGQRVVFSSQPTPVQLQATGLTADFVTTLLGNPSDQPGIRPSTGGDQTNPPQPSQAILAVANRNGTLSVRLVVYDQSGVQIFSQEEELTLHPTEAAQPIPESVDKPDSAAVQMSTATEGLEKGGFETLIAKPSEFDKVSLDLLLHPEKNDPLSFFATDAIVQRDVECGDQLVADLPDNIVIDRTNTAKQYLDKEAASGKLVVKEDNGWLMVTPCQPAVARVEHANRAALASLVQEAHTKGDACLTDMALFADAEGHSPIDGDGGVCDASAPYIHIFIPEWQDFAPSDNRFDLLVFYGFLTDGQRQDLQSNQPIPVANLSNDAKVALEAVAYGAYARYRVEQPAARRPQGPREIPGTNARVVGRNGHRRISATLGQTSYLAEPTEIFGDGIPPAGTVKLSINSTNPANNGLGGLNEFTFHFTLLPQVTFDQQIAEPAGGI